jgi:hypothetical protein
VAIGDGSQVLRHCQEELQRSPVVGVVPTRKPVAIHLALALSEDLPAELASCQQMLLEQQTRARLTPILDLELKDLVVRPGASQVDLQQVLVVLKSKRPRVFLNAHDVELGCVQGQNLS